MLSGEWVLPHEPGVLSGWWLLPGRHGVQWGIVRVEGTTSTLNGFTQEQLMNDRVFDAVARRTARALDRRSLLGLVTGIGIAAAATPRRMIAKKNHHHHPDGGGGGGGGNNDKDKKCKKDGKSYTKLLDGLCVAQYFYDLVLAASCAACFDVCAGHVAKCKTGDARACTNDCGLQFNMPIRYK